jgi:hypothetical protein
VTGRITANDDGRKPPREKFAGDSPWRRERTSIKGGASLSSAEPFAIPCNTVLPMVLRCWKAIGELATELCLGNEIGHTDVCAALGLTDGGGPGSFELANIRAGLRAVPA